MSDDKELTITDYLSEYVSKEMADNDNFTSRMCNLLSGPLGDTDCEGGWEAVHQMCDIHTSTTYAKSQLDWAYRKLSSSM